ncbi:MAG: acetoin utilization protein AcuC [Thermaerobacter sp.]|nr:acetoin utilization protein AcuC [Thermaerobacter sp.]
MSGRAVFVYSDAYQAYRFTPDHPFNPVRLGWTVDVLGELGLLHPEERVAPRPAALDEILLAHSPAYVDVVQELGRLGRATPAAAFYGLGTEDDPVFAGMHEAAALSVGGTLVAAEQILSGQALHALNIGGGFHHAMRSQAAGFCIYNDVSITIAKLRDAGLRVAYIDIDAHHGDGVQEAFYRDPDVLTVSFHESGRYLFPGTGWVEDLGAGPGYGTSLNLPLEPFTDDASWLELLDAVLDPALKSFRADILITEFGVDGHALDPLTDLRASTRFYWEAAARLHTLAHRHCKGRWLAVGGGGYELLRVVPRAWAILWAEMRGTPIPESTPLPVEFRARHADANPPLPGWMVDPRGTVPPLDRQREISGRNRATLAKLRHMCPLFADNSTNA